MRVLVLDDMQERLDWFKKQLIGHEATLVKQASSAISLLKKEQWDAVFLDHDLGGAPYVHNGPDGMSGMDVANAIVNMDSFPPLVVVHSLNEDCRKEMVARMVEVGCNALELPFTTLMKTGITLNTYV